VLKFFQSKGAASDAGCTVLEAAQALASNGVQEAQVRSIVQGLVDDGHLYSTIDDDHFKSTDP
jgi:replication factor A2